jgi:hypothetical protein
MAFKDEGVRVRLACTQRDGEISFVAKACPMEMTVRFIGVQATDVRSPAAGMTWRTTKRGTEVSFDASQGAELEIIGRT